MSKVKVALFYFQSQQNTTLSYNYGWPRAFRDSHIFDADLFNLSLLSLSDQFKLFKKLGFFKYDCIVLLHSVFSNQNRLSSYLGKILSYSAIPKIYFIGNEYKLMPEKMKFCDKLRISLLISQSNDPIIHAAYRERLKCSVACIPNTGHDPTIFYPQTAFKSRQIDVGYRSYEEPWYLGNIEKSQIAQYFLSKSQILDLKSDISMDPTRRFNEHGYASFLNSCKFQIGTESGTDFFDLDDYYRLQVNQYQTANPSATWHDIQGRFFSSSHSTLVMRIISGRQVEAAACKTVQILFKGRYNNYFKPDIHYIPLEKDFSNIGEVIEKMNDDIFCAELAVNAYNVAVNELSYSSLLAKLKQELEIIL